MSHSKSRLGFLNSSAFLGAYSVCSWLYSPQITCLSQGRFHSSFLAALPGVVEDKNVYTKQESHASWHFFFDVTLTYWNSRSSNPKSWMTLLNVSWETTAKGPQNHYLQRMMLWECLEKLIILWGWEEMSSRLRATVWRALWWERSTFSSWGARLTLLWAPVTWVTSFLSVVSLSVAVPTN